MEVILLERIAGLGNLGDKVAVKSGFGRNFLIPQGKAMHATEFAIAEFEARRAQLETEVATAKAAAEELAAKFEGVSITLTRQASETGQLFGSVKPQNVVDSLAELGLEVKRQAVIIGEPIKTVDEHTVRVVLNPEVSVELPVNVVRQTAAVA